MVHPREHVAVKALESERACTSIEHRNVMRIVRRAMEQREKLENSVGNTFEEVFVCDDYGQAFENLFFFLPSSIKNFENFSKARRSISLWSILNNFGIVLFAFQIINNAIFGIVLIVPKLANYRIIYREIDKDKVSGNFSYPVLLLSTNLDGNHTWKRNEIYELNGDA